MGFIQLLIHSCALFCFLCSLQEGGCSMHCCSLQKQFSFLGASCFNIELPGEFLVYKRS